MVRQRVTERGGERAQGMLVDSSLKGEESTEKCPRDEGEKIEKTGSLG